MAEEMPYDSSQMCPAAWGTHQHCQGRHQSRTCLPRQACDVLLWSSPDCTTTTTTNWGWDGDGQSTSEGYLASFAGIQAGGCESAHKAAAPWHGQLSSCAEKRFLTVFCVLSAEYGPVGRAQGYIPELQRFPQHNIPILMWPDPMNTNKEQQLLIILRLLLFLWWMEFHHHVWFQLGLKQEWIPPKSLQTTAGSISRKGGWLGRQWHLQGILYSWEVFNPFSYQVIRRNIYVFERAERAEKQIRPDCSNYQKHCSSVKVYEERGFTFSSQRHACVPAIALIILIGTRIYIAIRLSMLLWIEYSFYLLAAAAMGISLMRAGSVSHWLQI